ncbi:MAG: cation diffusion facilitator family transporter [Dysgonomonas sp.]
MQDDTSRNRILRKTSWISTIGNAVLSVAKIVVGFISGSIAVIGDGIDSATDVVISLVMLVTSRIVTRPPDCKYAYGYDKAESISTKILSFVIFYAGMQMLVSSAKNIFQPEMKSMPSAIAVYVTVFSIMGKLCLSWYQYRQGRRAGSQMLMANAKNMRNDVIISLGVLLGLVFTFVFKLPVLDSVTGLIISVYILRSAVGVFMDSNVELMDGVKDTKVYNQIFDAVDRVPGAYNPHRVRSRQIGGKYMISLDIEVDGSISLNEAHEIAEAVEDSIKASVDNVYDIVVHVEPKDRQHDAEMFGVKKDMVRTEEDKKNGLFE